MICRVNIVKCITFAGNMWLGSLIEWGMTHLTYWVVFILMVMENSVFPLPAELIVTPAAYNAANGLMSIPWLVVITTLGSTVGAIINYYLSLYIGRPAIHRFADSRVGRFFMLSSKKMEVAEDLFRRKGNISIFVGRLLPAGRQFISIPAGLAKMNIWAFVFYTTIGSAIWNGFLIGVGCYLAYIIPMEEANEVITKYTYQINIILFSAIGVIAVYLIGKKIYRKMK